MVGLYCTTPGAWVELEIAFELQILFKVRFHSVTTYLWVQCPRAVLENCFKYVIIGRSARHHLTSNVSMIRGNFGRVKSFSLQLKYETLRKFHQRVVILVMRSGLL